MKFLVSALLIISMGNELYLVMTIRHPTPVDEIHNLSFMQAHISADEKKNGHLSLAEAISFESEDCQDNEYTYWVKAELNEWLVTLAKAENTSTEENLIKDKKIVGEAIKDLTETCEGQDKFLTQHGEGNVVSNDNVYNYDSSCVMSMIRHCIEDAEESDCFKEPKLCTLVLKQMEDLEDQIDYLIEILNPDIELYKRDIQNKVSGICCDNTCGHCEEPNSETSCVKCKSEQNRELSKDGADTEGTCECLAGFFDDETTESDVCVHCDKTCLKCEGKSTDCEECNTGYSEKTDPVGSKECECVAGRKEVENSLKNPPTWTCEVCPKECATCDAAGCITCEKDCHERNSEGLCVVKATCVTTPEEEVVPCGPLCFTCGKGDPDHCLSCHDSHKRKLTPAQGGNCSCGKQNYGLDKFDKEVSETENLICELCDASCDQCDQNDKDCKACPDNKSKSLTDTTDTYCYPDEGFFCDHCANGTTPEEKEPGKPCDNNCKTCEETATKCKTCVNETTMEIKGDKCVCKAGEGFISEKDNQAICIKCHITCKACNGNGENDCTECDGDSREFEQNTVVTDPVTGKCIPKEGFYECDMVTAEACPCPNECTACTSQTSCTQCKQDGDSTDKIAKAGVCQCKEGTRPAVVDWKVNENYQCIPCSDHVTKCITQEGPDGPEEVIQECNTEFNLVQTPVDKDGVKVCKCTDGNYAPNPEQVEKCYPCNKTCKQCEFDAYQCTECIDKENEVLLYSSCLCKSNLYRDSENKCKPCQDSCTTCTAGSYQDCINNSDNNTNHPNNPNRSDIHYIFLVEGGKDMQDIFNPDEPLTEDTTTTGGETDGPDGNTTEENAQEKKQAEPKTKYETAKAIVNEFIKKIAAFEAIKGITGEEKDDISTILFDEEVTEVYAFKPFDEGLVLEGEVAPAEKPLDEQLDDAQKDPSDKNDSGIKAGIEKIEELIDQNPNFKDDKFIVTIIIDENTVITQADIELISDHPNIEINIIILNNSGNDPVNVPDEVSEKDSVTTVEVKPDDVNDPPETPIVDPVDPNTEETTHKGIPVCNDGYYMDTNILENPNENGIRNSNQYCKPCLDFCVICETGDTCETCVEDREPNVGESTTSCDCRDGKEEFGGQCVEQCETKQYRDSQTGECQPCQDEDCLECTAASNGAECQTCKDGQYNDNGECLDCMKQCTTCEDGTTCKTCTSPRELQGTDCECETGYTETASKTCRKDCTETQYNESDAVCKECSDNTEFCTKCSDGSGVCSQCDATLNRKIDGTQCICLEGFVEVDNACVPCDANCKECKIDAVTCENCNDNASVDTVSKKCVCDDGFTAITADGICEPCNADNNCVTCTDSADTCTTCQSPTDSEEVNDAGKCVCKEGFFRDNQLLCKECHENCETCNGPNEEDCLTCSDANNRKLEGSAPAKCEPKDGFTECDQGQIVEACKCHWMCRICDGQTKNDCEQCFNKFDRTDSTVSKSGCTPRPAEKCYANQVVGAAGGEVTATCNPCDSSCKLCKGPETTDCTECKESFKPIENPSQGGECKCEAGKWLDQLECKDCLVKCKTCLDGITCTQCNSTEEPTPTRSSTSQCPCLEGFYEAGEEDCKECDIKCKTCTSESKCTECAVTKAEGRDFQLNCEVAPGFFENVPKTAEPGKCDKTCKTCLESSSDSCTECPIDRVESETKSTTTDGVNLHACICKDGKFHQIFEGTPICSKCDNACAACTGNTDADCACIKDATNTDCEKCNTQEKFKWNEETQKCEPEDGRYTCSIDSIKTTCPCHAQCKTCYDKEKNNCESCIEGATFIEADSTCDPDVGNFWEPGTEPTHTLEECNDRCEDCLNTADNCTLCAFTEIEAGDTNKNNMLKLSGNQCKCSTHQFEGANEVADLKDDFPFFCNDCKPECKTCENAEGCLTCKGENTVVGNAACPCMQGYHRVDTLTFNCETKGPQSIKLDLMGVVDVNNPDSDGSIQFGESDGNEEVCKVINTVVKEE